MAKHADNKTNKKCLTLQNLLAILANNIHTHTHLTKSRNEQNSGFLGFVTPKIALVTFSVN